MHYQQAERRLEKLEYTLGLNRRKKPQAFADIDNIIAEIKRFQAQKFDEFTSNFDTIN